MFWQEQSETREQQAVDLTFRANAKCLPADHAEALSAAVIAVLPWIKTEKHAGIHLIRLPTEGNGWQLSDSDLLYMPRRLRFALRVPMFKSDEVLQLLDGSVLDVDGYKLKLSHPQIKPLVKNSTIYAHNIVIRRNMSDDDFLSEMVAELKLRKINVKKILSGKAHEIQYSGSKLFTKSLLLVDLELNDALQLQAEGIGNYKHLGCGLFVPHKAVSDRHK